jgi:hypothetical protein
MNWKGEVVVQAGNKIKENIGIDPPRQHSSVAIIGRYQATEQSHKHTQGKITASFHGGMSKLGEFGPLRAGNIRLSYCEAVDFLLANGKVERSIPPSSAT